MICTHRWVSGVNFAVRYKYDETDPFNFKNMYQDICHYVFSSISPLCLARIKVKTLRQVASAVDACHAAHTSCHILKGNTNDNADWAYQ